MNCLMLSSGRRCELIKDFKKTMSQDSRIVAVDNSKFAPALYVADVAYTVPRIDDPEYISVILDICRKEKIDVILTLYDPEISLLAENKPVFTEIGIEVLVPSAETAYVCFDKFLMYNHLLSHGIKTVKTWGTVDSFDAARKAGEVDFPVFVKPRRGSGSVGARKIDTYESLVKAFSRDGSLIVQEYMKCEDLDADVYIDTISHKPVAAFSKKKIETSIGGAKKTVSFKDEKLFEFIKSFVATLDFCGPIDIDFFYKNGEYYLSEVNPRFGGAYLHAYGAGVDFVKYIENNISGIENQPSFGEYEEGVVMMMYDSVVIRGKDELAE